MKEFCKKVYHNVYQETKRNLEDKENASRNSETRMNEIEAAAQKEAIKQSIIQTMKQFPNNDVAEIWKPFTKYTYTEKAELMIPL